jgi:competence protein ComEC
MKPYLLFCIFFCFPLLIQPDSEYLFIVWDVGQGSWSTLVEPKKCLHVDMGGQVSFFRERLLRYCSRKKNFLVLTHLDKDHLNFVKKFSRSLRLCLMDKHSFSDKKQLPIEDCKVSHLESLTLIYQSRFSVRNESNLYILVEKILITGDQPKSLEALSSGKLKSYSIETLVVGHHGSKTSSGSAFLKSLPLLKNGLVSAFKKRYGHPHQQTKKKFRKIFVPLIDTESYGTLIMDISQYYIREKPPG